MLRTINARAAAVVACAFLLSACSSNPPNTLVPSTQPHQVPLDAASTAQHLSLSDFLAAQGSCITPAQAGTLPPGAAIVNGCVLFVPFAPNFDGWGVAPSTAFCSGFTTAAIDYAGIVNNWLVENGHASLGTATSGSVTERRMPDGSGQVTVELSTRNALQWGGCDPNFNFATATVLFGNRPDAVLTGATPALGSSKLRFVYSEPQYGVAPYIDLIRLNMPTSINGGYVLISEQFFSTGSGPLHNAFEDVADGTPGQMVVGQNGTFNTVGKGSIDGFTAEFVKIFPK